MISNWIFSGSGLLLLSGLLCLALAAMLFNDRDHGKTQDVYGLDPAGDHHHWLIVWAGAIQFAFGVVLALIGLVVRVVEKL